MEKAIFLKKKFLVTALILVGLLIAAAAVVVLFDNSNLKPSKDHVTDFVASYSPYAVRTLYDAQKRPVDIVVVKAKSGVSVAQMKPQEEVVRYEVHEVSSHLILTLYNSKNAVVEIKSFDTKTQQWVK